jgi:acylglycerol lipase
MEPLTSGASNRIIPLLKAFRASLLFVYTFFLSFLLFVLPRRNRAVQPSSPKKHLKRRWLVKEEEDTFRRRLLAQDVGMGHDDGCCRWNTSIFYGVRNNALFCRSWFPVFGDVK